MDTLAESNIAVIAASEVPVAENHRVPAPIGPRWPTEKVAATRAASTFVWVKSPVTPGGMSGTGAQSSTLEAEKLAVYRPKLPKRPHPEVQM